MRRARASGNLCDTISALAAHCPDLRFATPEGGIYLWAQLPKLVSAREVEAAAAAEGVSVRSGDSFLTDDGTSSHIRLCFASPAMEEIQLGAQRLGRALRSVLKSQRGALVQGAGFASV